MLEGGTIPVHFAESRTVLVLKSSDIDDNGRIIRSPEALQLQDTDHSNLSRPPLVHHEMYSHLSEMHLFQTNDG